MKLVIVESPTKAKTITKFLGKDFHVKSSFGHIRDLPKKDMGVDIEKNYEPTYIVPADKKEVISELKKLTKQAQDIILATDEDREGEAIAWHLAQVLGLDPQKTKRIVFHEITKSAINQALSQPRTIHKHLVDAQQARRIIDRLVGYELSPFLWRKVARGLSAGRVQSVAVRLIVEREREIHQFTPIPHYKVEAIFPIQTANLHAELDKKLEKKEDIIRLLSDCKDAIFSIASITKKESKKTPSAPFTTSTLQQEASTKLGYSVSRTMINAQKLYEQGFITYMRTDSVNLSEQAREQMSQYIQTQYGDAYVNARNYATKSAGAQEAHEAIRPTDISKKDIKVGKDELKLYKLIWKRSVASQMSEARIEKTQVTIDISTSSHKFIAHGEVIAFNGFLKVYQEDSDKEYDKLLPPLTQGQKLTYSEIVAYQSFSKPTARYTEASLVKKLEALGIGRPSTYAPTISTIQKRGYILKESRPGTPRPYEVISLVNGQKEIKEETKTETFGAEKNKLFPTDIALVVTDFLIEHFPDILDYHFTADIEKDFDEIAQGKQDWTRVVDEIYKPFHKHITENLQHVQRQKGERLLGIDPKTKRKVYARLGRFGPMVQIGEKDDEEKPKFAKLLTHQSIETISLEEALELFKLPRIVGEFEGLEIKASIGRFGPYVMHNGKFASLKEGQDPLSITLEDAIILVKEKQEKDANKYIKEFPEEKIQILNGRYGPYIKQGRKNYKIPKDREPQSLTLEDCKKIIEEAPEKPTRRKK